MTFVDTLISKAALSMVIASHICCSQANLSEAEFRDFCSNRLDSAQRLTSEAKHLIHANQRLSKELELCQTIMTYGTPGEPDKKFSSVLDDYQAARALYLKHREQYDLHVKEFHQQAKQDNRPLPPLVVPEVKPMAIAVEEACAQLQAFEQQLRQSESELCSMIQQLQSLKGKIPEDTYFQKWLNTQTMATNVQGGALEFNRQVSTKGVNSANKLHAAAEAANVSGDYVQSRKAFAFAQASASINNEETRRAHLHSTLASQCFIYINALNPNSTSPDSSSTITADQLVTESSELQTEYDDLQQKYSSVHDAKAP